MSSQQTNNSDALFDRIARFFQPQLQDIKDQLDDLVTRREHDKDITELSADIAALQRDRDRMQEWADKRPRESADVTWVKRIEMDVQALQTRMAQQPDEARAWFSTANQGIGTLIAIAALILSLLLGVLPHITFH